MDVQYLCTVCVRLIHSFVYTVCQRARSLSLSSFSSATFLPPSIIVRVSVCVHACAVRAVLAFSGPRVIRNFGWTICVPWCILRVHRGDNGGALVSTPPAAERAVGQ